MKLFKYIETKLVPIAVVATIAGVSFAVWASLCLGGQAVSDIRFAALCFVAAALLICSVALHLKGKDGSGWGFVALIFIAIVALKA